MTLKDFIKVFNNETRFLIIGDRPEDDDYSVLFCNVTNTDPVDIDVFDNELFKDYTNIVTVDLEFDIQNDTSYVCIHVTKD